MNSNESTPQTEIIEEELIDESSGSVVKTVRKIALKKIKAEVPEVVAKRMQWKKFGAAKNSPPGPSSSTTIIGEEVTLKLERNKDFNAETPANKQDRKLTCRICFMNHWTSKCPFKGTLVGAEGDVDEEMTKSIDQQASLTAGSSKYIPPSMRNREFGDMREDSWTIRVTNLSQYAVERDLYTMFNRDGMCTTRVYLARDYDTGECRGYAFVSFATKDEAQRAIDLLNGHGFDNLIIKCEWAKERKAA